MATKTSTTSQSSKDHSSSMSKIKVAAGVAGVAAAAAAGVVAVRKMRSSNGRRTFQVKPHEDGWQVHESGHDRATSLHETKKEALEAARNLANTNQPSRLEIRRVDGSVQDRHDYGELEA